MIRWVESKREGQVNLDCALGAHNYRAVLTDEGEVVCVYQQSVDDFGQPHWFRLQRDCWAGVLARALLEQRPGDSA